MTTIQNWQSLINTAIRQHRLGQLAEAESSYQKLLQIQPDCIISHSYLGHLFLQQNKLDEAGKSYQNVLKIEPNHSVALKILNNLGKAFQQRGELEKSAQFYRQVLHYDSNFTEAHYNLGNVCQQQGELAKAVQSYHQAIRLDPNLAEAYNNLGNVLTQQGELERAKESYRQVLRLNPNWARIHYNLGNVFAREGSFEKAVECYQQALKLNPNLAEAYNNLGNIFARQDRLKDAAKSYRQALKLDPNLAEAYNNLGDVLARQNKLEQAEEFYRQALRLDPDLAEAKIGLCMSQLPVIYANVNEIELRRNNYQKHLQDLARSCKNLDRTQLQHYANAIGSSQPFFLAYQGLSDRDLQQTYGELICQIMLKCYPQWSKPIALPHLEAKDKIRIGFISGYFRNHSNWKIPIQGWVENFDKNRFELFGYHTGSIQDEETAKAAKAFVKFIQGSLSFERWLEIIAQDKLHILIFPEFGMDPMTVKLGCLRLAPIQMTSWGHPQTSGLPTIDYYLSSDLMEVSNAQEHYTETLVRLPNLSIYYTPRNVLPETRSKREIGLKENDIMFWCCQSLYKYLPQHDDVFPRIARELTNCRFVFIKYARGKYVTEVFCQRLDRAFAEYGLNYRNYCLFLPSMDNRTFVGTTAIADVFLDSIGWSGCNSTLESLDYNLPIVTLPGDLMRGRHTRAILQMMGIEETIATNKDDYVSIAVRLGKDSQYRQQISRQVAENKHKLYGDLQPIKALENLFLNLIYRQRSSGAEEVFAHSLQL
jgi:predicted O-linked N-acetylglucosamine transferase (SPINDLY family)